MVDEKRYCRYCGQELFPDAYVCPHCGRKVQDTTVLGYQRSRLVAGLLALFVGTLGIHNFYLGYNGKGVTQLLITVIGSCLFFIGPIISGIWAIIDAIMIFTGIISQDADGTPLQN